MKTIKFKCNGQRLRRVSSCLGLTTGSKGYLQCTFTFDSDLSTMAKVAEFRNLSSEDVHPVPVKQNACMVPDEVTDGKIILVRIVAKKGDVRLRTNEAQIRQEG